MFCVRCLVTRAASWVATHLVTCGILKAKGAFIEFRGFDLYISFKAYTRKYWQTF